MRLPRNLHDEDFCGRTVVLETETHWNYFLKPNIFIKFETRSQKEILT